MNKETRRSHTREIKLEAVRTVEDGRKTVAEVGWKLGLHDNVLHRWSRELDAGEALHARGCRT